MKYAYWTGSAWAIQTVQSGVGSSKSTSIVLDASTRPHISYYDANGGDLKYARWTGASWSVETVEDGVDAGEESSLCLDASGNPHIAYSAAGSLKYAAWTGGSWSINRLDSFSSAAGGYYTVSMNLDPADGMARIAYSYSGLKYAARDSTPEPPNTPGTPTVSTRTAYGLNWTWLDNSPDETGFRVRRAGTGALLADLPSGTTEWAQTGLSPNTSDRIYVEAYNAAGGSSSPNSTVQYTLANPPAGSNFSNIFSDTIVLSWSADGNAGGTVYRAEYSPDGVAFTEFYTGTSLYAAAMGLVSDTVYYFRVRAQNADGTLTSYDAVVSARTLQTGPAPSTSGWEKETVNGDAPVTYTSLALDPSGNPHISYFAGGAIKYAKNTAGSWVTETVASGVGASGGYTSIALDSSNVPYISYYDAAADRPKYAKRAGSWSSENIGTYTGMGRYTSIAVDSSGLPHFSLYDQTYTDFYYYHKNGTGGWDSYHLSGSDIGAYSSIAVRSNVIQISFCDSTNGYLLYSSGTSVSNLSNGIAVAGYGCRDTDIAIDSTGKPHISFFGTTNGDLVYAKWTGSSWSAQIVDSPGIVGQYPSIALDAFDRPVISYYDATNDDLKIARWTGSSWTTQTVDTAQGQYTSAGVNSSGEMRIVYGSAGLKYARETSLFWPGTPGVSARTGSSLTWSWTDNSTNETGFRVRRASDDVKLSGNLPAGTVSWTQTGLSPNSAHQVYVEAFNANNTSWSSDSDVSYTAANAPSGSVLTDVFISSATLSWSAAGNPAGSVYRAEKSTDNVSFGEFYSGADLSTTTTDLSEFTSYFFRVRAENGDGVLTAYSAVVSTRTKFIPIAAPSGLAVDRTATDLTWTWADNSDNEAGFRVRRSSDDVNLSGDLAEGTTSWIQAGLAPNGPQQVYIQAFRSAVTSDSPDSPVTYTLAVPPAGTSVAGVFVTSVTLSWSANGNTGETAYRAEKSVDNISFSEFYSGAALSVVATGLPEYTTHYFRVRAENGNGLLTAYDAAVSTRTRQAPPAAPGTPAVSTRTTSGLTWSWADNASDELGYRVRRVSDGADLSGGLPPDTNAWTQNGLGVNSAQQVYVEAFRETNQAVSGPSTLSHTLANPPAGTMVDGVFVSSTALSWSANGNPSGTIYRVEGSPVDLSFTERFSGAVSSAAITGLNPQTAYRFRVRAENGDGLATAYDAVVQAVTEPLIATAGGGILSLETPHGPILLNLPPSAFPDGTSLAVNLSPAFPPPSSPVLRFVGSGIGADISDGAAGPLPGVSLGITFSYLDADFGGVDETRLVVARYDPSRGCWLPLPSNVDATSNRVTAVTGELGLFQVMMLVPSAVVDTVKAWPNPVRSGGTMTFSDLPAHAGVKIYTLMGEAVAERIADVGGIAEWDGRTDSGGRAASGVYLARIEGAGGSKIIKIAVQR